MKSYKGDKDVLVVSVMTLVATLLTLLIPPDIVFIRLLSLPLVFVLPGYALTAAFFPRRTFGIYELILFSLGLSMVIVIAGGLMLNVTPFGLHAGSWAVWLASMTLSGCAVAHIRRGRSETLSRRPVTGKSGLTLRQWILLSLSALLVCGAVVASVIGALQQEHPGFTQLWMLPTGGSDSRHAVQLGVSNKAFAALEYSLDVTVNGKVVQKWPSIYLRPDEQWQTTLLLPQAAPAPGTSRVEAMLYRVDAPTKVYRKVVLWLNT